MVDQKVQFKCTLAGCDKTLTQSTLFYHLRKFHNGMKIRDYNGKPRDHVCDVCKRQYSTKEALRVHVCKSSALMNTDTLSDTESYVDEEKLNELETPSKRQRLTANDISLAVEQTVLANPSKQIKVQTKRNATPWNKAWQTPYSLLSKRTRLEVEQSPRQKQTNKQNMIQSTSTPQAAMSILLTDSQGIDNEKSLDIRLLSIENVLSIDVPKISRECLIDQSTQTIVSSDEHPDSKHDQQTNSNSVKIRNTRGFTRFYENLQTDLTLLANNDHFKGKRQFIQRHCKIAESFQSYTKTCKNQSQEYMKKLKIKLAECKDDKQRSQIQKAVSKVCIILFKNLSTLSVELVYQGLDTDSTLCDIGQTDGLFAFYVAIIYNVRVYSIKHCQEDLQNCESERLKLIKAFNADYEDEIKSRLNNVHFYLLDPKNIQQQLESFDHPITHMLIISSILNETAQKQIAAFANDAQVIETVLWQNRPNVTKKYFREEEFKHVKELEIRDVYLQKMPSVHVYKHTNSVKTAFEQRVSTLGFYNHDDLMDSISDIVIQKEQSLKENNGSQTKNKGSVNEKSQILEDDEFYKEMTWYTHRLSKTLKASDTRLQCINRMLPLEIYRHTQVKVDEKNSKPFLYRTCIMPLAVQLELNLWRQDMDWREVMDESLRVSQIIENKTSLNGPVREEDKEYDFNEGRKNLERYYFGEQLLHVKYQDVPFIASSSNECLLQLENFLQSTWHRVYSLPSLLNIIHSLVPDYYKDYFQNETRLTQKEGDAVVELIKKYCLHKDQSQEPLKLLEEACKQFFSYLKLQAQQANLLIYFSDRSLRYSRFSKLVNLQINSMLEQGLPSKIGFKIGKQFKCFKDQVEFDVELDRKLNEKQLSQLSLSKSKEYILTMLTDIEPALLEQKQRSIEFINSKSRKENVIHGPIKSLDIFGQTFYLQERRPQSIESYIKAVPINDETGLTFLAYYLLSVASKLIEEKICHEQISPESILVGEGNEVMLEFTSSQKAICTQEVLDHHSPENFKPCDIDSDEIISKMDAWGVGFTLYWLMTGKSPFTRSQLHDLYVKQIPLPTLTFQKDSEVKLHVLMHKLLETETENRPTVDQALKANIFARLRSKSLSEIQQDVSEFIRCFSK